MQWWHWLIVGVIMILILGYVSVTDMTADLLPSIELPYSIVTTVFAGASPEEVETSVTRPVESAMSTVSNIKSINPCKFKSSRTNISQRSRKGHGTIKYIATNKS